MARFACLILLSCFILFNYDVCANTNKGGQGGQGTKLSRKQLMTKKRQHNVNSRVDIEQVPKVRSSNLEVQAFGLLQKPLSSMLRIQALMFFFYATLGSALPYLPIYYKEMGISDSVVGLLGAVTPTLTFLVSPLWGALADSTGKHKLIMIVTFLGSVLVRNILVFRPSNMLLLTFIVAVCAALNAPVKVSVLKGYLTYVLTHFIINTNMHYMINTLHSQLLQIMHRQ